MREQDDPMIIDELMEINRPSCGVGLEVGRDGAQSETGDDVIPSVINIPLDTGVSAEGQLTVLVAIQTT